MRTDNPETHLPTTSYTNNYCQCSLSFPHSDGEHLAVEKMEQELEAYFVEKDQIDRALKALFSHSD